MTIYYLGVRFTPETNSLLHEYRLLANLSQYKEPKLGFHTTIVHSHTPFTYTLSTLPTYPIGTTDHTAQLFNTSLVLPYTTPYLQETHDIVIKNGATPNYSIYSPHITIAEDYIYTGDYPLTSHITIPIRISEIFYMEWEPHD